MNFRIIFEKEPEKYLRRQNKQTQSRILKAINALPNNGDIKKLTGTNELFRVRIGNVRVIFSVDRVNGIIDIVAMGSRGQIYRYFL